MSADEKQQCLEQQRRHLELAVTGRMRYKASVALSRDACKEKSITVLEPSQDPPTQMHYSWDYAQVGYPKSFISFMNIE